MSNRATIFAIVLFLLVGVPLTAAGLYCSVDHLTTQTEKAPYPCGKIIDSQGERPLLCWTEQP